MKDVDAEHGCGRPPVKPLAVIDCSNDTYGYLVIKVAVYLG